MAADKMIFWVKCQWISVRMDGQQLHACMLTQTSWCPPSGWAQCRWCLWQSRAGRPSPGQRWRRCSSSSRGCSWTSGLCGQCPVFLPKYKRTCKYCIKKKNSSCPIFPQDSIYLSFPIEHELKSCNKHLHKIIIY